MAIIKATPAASLVDDEVAVTVSGLRSRQRATVSALFESDGVTYMSYAHFTATETGSVELRMMDSQGGTYFGTESMGLFWSAVLTPDMRAGSRLMKRDVTTPIKVRLCVHEGHVIMTDPRNIPVLAETWAERFYLSQDVERIPLPHNNLRATLFVPKGPGQYIGILDLYGSAGGIPEYRAALLASRGFVVLALGYFFSDTLRFESGIEYFEEAVEYLWNHPRVLKTGIGTIGISKGAEIAIQLSIFCHKVKAVVSIGGVAWPTGVSHTYKGSVYPHCGTAIFLEELPNNKYKVRLKKMEDNSYAISHTSEGIKYIVDVSRVPRNVIYPVEKSEAQLLMLSGDDDCCVPPDADRVITDRLRQFGRQQQCQVVRYKGAGHLIEPPYGFHSRIAFNSLYDSLFIWGGSTVDHAKAQIDSWNRIQSFLREHLSSETAQSKL